MRHRRLDFLFILFLVFFFFNFSFISAQDKSIIPDDIQNKIELPQYDVKDIISSLNRELSNKVIDLITSDDSKPSQQAALLILRKSVRDDFLDYSFNQVPLETSEYLIKIALQSIPLLAQGDTSQILDKIEKMTVKQAVNYSQNYLLQSEEKVSFGALKTFSYTSLWGHTQNPIFQYILISKPIKQTNQVYLSIKIYSPYPLEPVKSTGSFSLGGSWEQDLWLQEGKTKIDPFIISISGNARRVSAGELNGEFVHNYYWDGQPDITIDFSNNVPDFGFKPKNFWQDKIDTFKESLKKKVDTIIHPNTSNILGSIKNIIYRQDQFSSDNDSLGAALVPFQGDGGEGEPEKSKENTETANSLYSIPTSSANSVSVSTSTDSHSQYKQKSKTRDKDKLVTTLTATKDKELEKTSDKQNKSYEQSEEDDEEKEDFSLPPLLISEVCSGFGSSKNEFIELYNPNNDVVNITDDNFKLELVSSKNKITKKKIKFFSRKIPGHGYFLLVGGQIKTNNNILSPDGKYASQLSSDSGVIITDGKGNILDRVSWGRNPPTSACEIQGVHLSNGLETNQSLRRRSSDLGLVDTNNNTSDFILSETLSPTNSFDQQIIYEKQIYPDNQSIDNNDSPSNDNGDNAINNNNNSNNGNNGNNPSDLNNQSADQQSDNSSTLSYPKILITEVQIASSSSSKDEFIELYNPNDDDVFLDNWYIQKKTKNSFYFSSFASRNLFAGKTIPAKSYFLISNESSVYSSLADILVSPHYTLAPDNAIVLKNPLKNVVDELEWGTIQDTNGNPCPNPRDDFSLSRKWASTSQSYIDTDNNASDFALGVPTPKEVNTYSNSAFSTNSSVTIILNSHTDLDGDGILDFLDDNTIVTSSVSLPAGEYTFKNLTISNGAVLTLSSSPSEEGYQGVKIQADNITIDAVSSISADGQGYKANEGPGKGVYSGGSYGGQGGKSIFHSSKAQYGLAYGDLFKPLDLGSGGTGYVYTSPDISAGGGAIQLNVFGTLDVEGTISANGLGTRESSSPGAGSGGSIYIKAKNIKGSGYITANGGDDVRYGETGGGGRIAVYYASSSFPVSHFEAYSGRAKNTDDYPQVGDHGGAGTIFIKSDAQTYGDLIIDNGGVRVHDKTILPLDKDYSFDNLLVGGGGDLSLTSNVDILNKIEINNSQIDFNGNSHLTCPEISLNNSFIYGPSQKIINLDVEQNVCLIKSQLKGNFDISANGLTVDKDSSISADGKGYEAKQGPGKGKYSGGSHGGQGGVSRFHFNSSDAKIGPVYETNSCHPIDFGSGGYCSFSTNLGSGGGLINIHLSDILNLDGLISANGDDATNSAGAGSGGSIYIKAKDISGSGFITADGGNDIEDNEAGGGGVIGIELGKDNISNQEINFHLDNIRVDPGQGWTPDTTSTKIQTAQRGVICIQVPKE